jgi:hypothetical protein
MTDLLPLTILKEACGMSKKKNMLTLKNTILKKIQ